MVVATKKKLKFWNIPVTEQLDKSVEKAVQINAHVSKADFIRDAVREKLEKMGLLGKMEASRHE
jgi:Arc/MetJ-type ribon-helix-helix transcriptional regulator